MDFLIQLLLPTTIPNVPAQAAIAALTKTRDELTQVFNGVTAYIRSPAKGAWTASDGHTEHDDVVMVEVVTDEVDRLWWLQDTTTLAERFRQDAIHVRAMLIQTLDEQPRTTRAGDGNHEAPGLLE